MISVEKPGSPSEILEHVGVKGMKWGVQKARTTGSAAGAGVAKKAGNFKAARAARPARKGIAPGRASREFRAQHPTGKLQAKAIKSARRESYAREKAIRKMRKKDSVEAARMQREHMNNPGTAIALRTTRGEKAAAGIIASAFLAGSKPGSAGRAVPTYTTAIAGVNVLERRGIERRQRKGGFK
jgi:hypothetical protein